MRRDFVAKRMYRSIRDAADIVDELADEEELPPPEMSVIYSMGQQMFSARMAMATADGVEGYDLPEDDGWGSY